jgi:hypothetical protein
MHLKYVFIVKLSYEFVHYFICVFVSLIAVHIDRRSNTGIVVSDSAQRILTWTVYIVCIGDPRNA